MDDKFSITPESIHQLAKILEETGLTELSVEIGDHKIKLGRNLSVPQTVSITPAALAHQPMITDVSTIPGAPAPSVTSHPGAVKSPLVGIAYVAPSPGATPFVTVGSNVNVDDTVLIVEAMKVMNPIRAHKSGKIVQILIQDAMPVEYGDVLMIIE